MELFQQLVKPLSVLGKVDRIGGRAEYTYTLFIEITAQLYGRLATEGDNYAVGLFNIDDVLNIFGREALEVQSVGRVEVGGYRFGVVVYDYDFVAEAL